MWFVVASVFLCVAVWFVDDVFVSLFFSFSQALGKPKPVVVWVSPSVSSSRTRSSPLTRTASCSTSPRPAPAPVFFFNDDDVTTFVSGPFFWCFCVVSTERKLRVTGAHGTTFFREPIFSLSFRLTDAAFLVCCFTPLCLCRLVRWCFGSFC